MIDVFQFVGAGSTLTLVGLCLKLAKDKKDTKETDNPNYIKRDECHSAMESQNKRIDDLRSHIDTRFDDLKDTFLKKQ